ncbi:MAG: DUF5320 domain-containing protein [Bacteroidales bacterium]|nr:DUF5320 domain-containing protein [Bacteroidales bacterium]
MPYQDGTGPNGNGSKSGRGRGRCGSNASTTNNGKRNGMGRGYGLGFRNRQTTDEKLWIERAIEEVKNQLLSLEKRKKELES